jgi:hypothetical protein
LISEIAARLQHLEQGHKLSVVAALLEELLPDDQPTPEGAQDE